MTRRHGDTETHKGVHKSYYPMPHALCPMPHVQRIKKLWQYVIYFLISISCCLMLANCTPKTTNGSSGDIVIGSKNFTEQVILGELLSKYLEAKTGLKVQRRLNMGGTFICHEALKAGQIDGYIEYTGTALTAVLKQKVITDPQETYRQVQQKYGNELKLTVGKPLGFNNTFAMIIRGDDARKFDINTLSESAKYTPQWQAGVGFEFLEREDGFPGLVKAYNLTFGKKPKIMDLGLIYRALVEKKVDFIAANSTDGLIAKLGLTILEDDKKYFPPYQAVPIFKPETLQKYPKIKPALDKLYNSISATQMQKMNYQVDGEFRKPEDVAREFLRSRLSN